jgi:succinoglycan biosynthesis transport protein ExoP
MDILAPHSGVSAGQPGNTVRPSQVIASLLRGSKLILLIAVAAGIAAYGFSKTRPELYRANATISIEGRSFAIPELQGATRSESIPDPMPLVRTEVQALVSRPIVQSVILALGMDRLPEFNPALRAPSVASRLREWLRRHNFLGSGTPIPSGAASEAILSNVTKALVISQDNRSFVIGITFTSQNPRLSAKFVNALVAEYIASRAQRRAAANHAANEEMIQRVGAVRSALRKLEDEMRTLRTKSELVELRAGSVGQQQVEVLATEVARASLDRAELEAQWQHAESLAQSGSSADLGTVLNSPTISRLRERETIASQNLAGLLSLDGPNNPGIRSAEANVQAARDQVKAEVQRIVASLSSQLAVARSHEADAERQLQTAKESAVKAENAQAELNELQQDINAQRTLYQTLLPDVQNTMAQSISSTMALDVRVLSSAATPESPSSPNTKLAGVMGASGGLALGFLLALARAYSTDRLYDENDVASAIGGPVTSVIRRGRSARSLLLRVRNHPGSQEAEALRSLRARLKIGGTRSVPRSVLFVSLDEGQDAAGVAAAFAYAAAGDGDSVVLLEGNLRQPRLPRLLEIKETGLLKVLQGEANWREVLLHDVAAHLDLLITQRGITSPQPLLSESHLQNLLQDLTEAYHLTVCSGASATRADTLALVREVNVTVLVVHAKFATRKGAREALSRLTMMSQSMVYVVFLDD